MKNKILFTIVIGVAVIAIFFMRKPTNNTDFIPVNDQGEQYFEELDLQNMKFIYIDNDSILIDIDFKQYNINEDSFKRNIPRLNKMNISAIQKDYFNTKYSVSKSRLDFFINNRTEEQLSKVGLGKPASEYINDLFPLLQLVVVRMEPIDSHHYNMSFFYTLRGILEEDMYLVVFTDEDGNSPEIGWDT
ncbi:hypothetical protein [Myroides sp.]|uniref:hypothetical protein n=1 Tax=Myroides sp. TaxID=1874736 RepID=UPI003F4174EB